MTQTIKFYKPYGVVSTFTDREGHSTLSEFIPIAGIYSAGRLDLDSEGLLILSDDGELIHRLTDPGFHHSKTYLVQVEGVISNEAIGRLSNGVTLRDYRSLPAEVIPIPEPQLPRRAKPVTPHGPTAWLQVILYEGKKRQIRHMTASVGLPTLRIVRVAIGPITVDNLQPGEWTKLSEVELSKLKQFIRGDRGKPKREIRHNKRG
jgi:23S rRNA pseudouridine2457 synthase